jgi:hypothetical protein
MLIYIRTILNHELYTDRTELSFITDDSALNL